MNAIFGYVSGILIVASFIPYIKDIFRGTTKPERASWLIWATLGSISLFAQWAKGASYSLWLTIAQTLGDMFIFLLAIKYGMGGLSKRDVRALIGAGAGLIVWYVTREAAIALFISIVIDGIGAVLTIMKSYNDPASETLVSWILTAMGGFFAIVSVGKINLVLLSYPVYIFLINSAIVSAIVLGKKRKLKSALR